MIRILKRSLLAISVLSIVALGIVALNRILQPSPESAEGLLNRADQMAWVNNWVGASLLFAKAEEIFRKRGDEKHALYAEVSEIPAQMESEGSLALLIARVNRLLSLPQARDPEVRLRILTIKGILELEYDAAMAKATWNEVEQLANQQHQWRLASRASGEQGILAFMLGNVSEATRRVKKAYGIARLFNDPAAHVRYAELIGKGICSLGRYKESLRWLDEAMSVAASHSGIAQPSVAYEAKIQALAGLGRYKEAEALADRALIYPRKHRLAGHLCSLLEAKGEVFEAEGNWPAAIHSFTESVSFGTHLQYWRGLTEANGKLAKAYEHEGQLQQALHAIDDALYANRQTPDELYFVPTNLAIKAEIEARLGNRKQSELLYLKGADILDGLLVNVPTPQVEQLLLTEVADLYSGYFKLLTDNGRYGQAFQVLEKARGRIEAQSLEYDRVETPHQPTEPEQRLQRLELRLLDTDDKQQRGKLLDAIYDAESELNLTAIHSAEEPVSLQVLQNDLAEDELAVEYVLAEPQSFALAITKTSIKRYVLPSKKMIESAAVSYRDTLRHRQTDLKTGHQLFSFLFGGIAEYKDKKSVIVIPDGQLNLLPFSALVDDSGNYVIANRVVGNAPSGTVLSLLRTRAHTVNASLPYLGVAAWTQTTDTRPWVVRSVTGPQRSLLLPLPESKKEVETIADLLPKPSTVLLGSEATKRHFESLPLDEYEVLHLALHGYADTEFPDRSALVFAPPPRATNDDGLLQAREIRRLHLNARLVTLSACDTGVGPVSEAGVANLSAAFIQAGAQSVVSTLWELEDTSTNRLMVFYDHLSRREGEAESLREAKLSLFRAGFKPYYWASFEIVGDSSRSLFLASNETSSSRLPTDIKETN